MYVLSLSWWNNQQMLTAWSEFSTIFSTLLDFHYVHDSSTMGSKPKYKSQNTFLHFHKNSMILAHFPPTNPQ